MDLETREYLDRMFGVVGKRFDRLDNRFDSLEDRFDRLEAEVRDLSGRVTKIEARLESLEARLANLESRFDNLESRFDWLYNAVGVQFETFVMVLTDRMDCLEERIERMDVRFTDDFIVVGQRLTSIDRRIESIGDSFTDLRTHFHILAGRIEGSDQRTDLLVNRVERCEEGINTMGDRVDSLTQEIRQRFRYVNAHPA